MSQGTEEALRHCIMGEHKEGRSWEWAKEHWGNTHSWTDDASLQLQIYKTSHLHFLKEKMQKKKGEYAEKIKNKVGLVHKKAEEKRAMVESKRGEELLKAEETAAKLRATKQAPPKACGCLGG